MRFYIVFLIPIVLMMALTITSFVTVHAQEQRECVQDRIAHIPDDLFTEVPDVPRLCEGLDLEKKRISVGDCELYCEVEGQGTPLVLINGGPGGTHHGFHPHFSRAASSAKVIYYDQRGCGLSDYEAGSCYSVDQAVDDLDRLRQALGVNKWVVLGWSYGGMLAQRYTLKHPESVAGLVLVASATGMNIKTGRDRQRDFMSKEEISKVKEIYGNRSLSSDVRLFNAHYSGDWKRQSFYRPTQEQLARMVRYEWKHDPDFRNSIFRNDYHVDLKGVFDACPIPTLLMEGKWDLTWGDEKAKNFHKHHPRAKLMIFKRSAHGLFEDEPDKFFKELEKFLGKLPKVKERDLAKWKKHLEKRIKDAESSPDVFINKLGWGRKSNEKIVEKYTKAWLDEIRNTGTLLKLGFALYDAKRYKEALKVFEKRAKLCGGNKLCLAVSLIWQGHMLDLMKSRKEAISLYKKVAAMNVNSMMRHDQFGIRYIPSEYAKELIRTPFIRQENKRDD